MSKVRVYEAAKQLNIDPKAAVAVFQSLGIVDVRNHMSSVEPEAIERVRRHLEKQKTHDVVEERIKAGVVKRRAVAKATPSQAEPHSDAMTARVVAPAPSSRTLEAPQNGNAVPSTPEIVAPPPEPSVRELIPAPPPSAKRVAEVREREPEPAPPSPPPPPEPIPEPIIAAEPPPPEPPPPASVTPPTQPSVSPPEPQQRPTSPKTGVEYWGGRPGVPMPTPASAQRQAIGGGSVGVMPRRTQYDPRASTQQGRGTMRGGAAAQSQRPGMGRQGAGGRRNQPQAPRKPAQVTTQEMSSHKKVIRIEENITLSTMAAKMSLKSTELLMKLLGMGMSNININTTLDADTAKILASDFGWEVEDVAVSEEQSIAAARGEEGKDKTDELMRSPVVTVMGHVDHGKTSLLDKIRKAKVAEGEAGGITQHIGAYKVGTSHGTLVFLDTPGHEAFTQMRARGASVTDLVVLVVAADDGVMPQTKEAVNHAKSAEVPIIVAVNKIDKPAAEPERVRRELVELGLTPEEWGGDTMYVNVSAMTGDGVEQLLEAISLQAEVLELKANPKLAARGTVLEALLDRGRGPVARVLVQDGTLRVGDFVLAGAGFGKVRAMTNEHGKQIQEAGPSTPVEILGLSDVPGAGDPMDVVKDPKKAQEIADSRKGKLAKSLIPANVRVSLEDIAIHIKEADQKDLRVIVKGDVQGSVEAVADSLAKLSGDRVKLSIIHAGVGAITEGDVNLAIAAKGIIVGFNVRPAGKAQSLAEESGIEIRLYSIIYQVVDDVRSAMEGLLPTVQVEKQNGKAEIRQLFKIKGIVVAGSHVIQGVVKRSGNARLIRDGVVLWTGKLAALKRFKDDAKEVAEGFDCGISLDGYNDLKEKDIVESLEIEEVKQKLA